MNDKLIKIGGYFAQKGLQALFAVCLLSFNSDLHHCLIHLKPSVLLNS